MFADDLGKFLGTPRFAVRVQRDDAIGCVQGYEDPVAFVFGPLRVLEFDNFEFKEVLYPRCVVRDQTAEIGVSGFSDPDNSDLHATRLRRTASRTTWISN